MDTIDTIREDWTKIANRINGKLYINTTLKAHVNAGIITVRISYSFNESIIDLHQAIFERGKGNINYSFVEISAELLEDNFILNLWRLDFFERLFNPKRMKTGIADFDKTIGFECSSQIVANDIFNVWEIRKELISNKNLLINSIDENSRRIIRMKSLIAPCETDEIEKFIELFNKISEQLQKKKLI